MEKSKTKHYIMNIMVWIVVILTVFPLIWMILSSIKQPEEVYSYPPIFFSKDPTLRHYIELFKVTNFEKYFINSTIVTFSTVVITLFIVVMTCYTITRFKSKGTNFLSKLYV